MIVHYRFSEYGGLARSVRRRFLALWVTGIAAVTSGGPAGLVLAQATPSETVQFEVASVKTSTETKHGLWYTGDHVQILGLTLQELVAAAYREKNYQIFGPGWIKSARFDVVAKLPDEAVGLKDTEKSARIWLMTQTLLAERFGLKAHHETRTLGACELVQDKGGLKLKETGPDPGYNIFTKNGKGRLSANNLPMRQFVEILSDLIDQPLVNKTGITGVFDVKLEWNPATASADAPATDAGDTAARADLRTALREQLGLRLEFAKLPVDVLVVDKVEKPSEN